MTFLPVVERELRVSARRRGTYWGRFTAGIIGVVLVVWIFAAMSGASQNLVGAALFAVVSTVVFLYATVAGTLVTCDCLSEEKREGTLGLLFLTDLKGLDVVLGKLVATSVNTFYGMLALLPMLAIPFIVGGVTQAEMLRVVLVSINLLFFFLSIGLFVSAVCRKDNWALGLACLIGLTLLLTGPLLTQFHSYPYETAALISSPATGCFMAFDSVYARNPHAHFWINAAVTHFYTWIFFGLACWIVPRSWQDAAMGKRMASRLAIPSIRRARKRLELLTMNPFLWRVERSGRASLLVWLMLLFMLGLWTGYVCWTSVNFFEPGVDFLFLVPAGFCLKSWLADAASRAFAEDHQSGGMELLLSTPLHERDIVQGQLMALWRQFGPPVIGVLLATLVFLIGGLPHCHTDDARGSLIACHLLLGAFLVGDMIALSWVGMWLGLVHRKPNRARLLAMARIVVLPVVLFVVLITLCALGLRGAEGEGMALLLWFMTGLGADTVFGTMANTKLLTEFRVTVSEGVTRKPTVQTVAETAPVLLEAP